MIHAIIIPILMGFSIFLCGMKLMELALHRLTGPRLLDALHSSTATPLHGLAMGTVSTALLQSSTAVTVITIGLVNARLLSFPRTLGIVLGTNIGTCLTTELIGLNIHALAVPLLIGSFGTWLLTALFKEMRLLPRIGQSAWLETSRSASVAVCGFGMLLAGLTIMQSIGPAVEQSALFDWFMARSANSLLWGVAAGTALTAAVHSSSAVIGLVMGFATIGAMPLDVGISIILGANIGTCVTAMLASIGGSRGGKLVALTHFVLNVGGAILFLPFAGELAAAAEWLSHSPASSIAHAQTIYNVACSLLALPVCYLPFWRKLQNTV
ncbi:Na/Pi symporter [Paenibacillus sp. J5C_2022]|uniref:Na/Pi cotransporter family protein n=1 Tax=Paenibacillus sp. J5C2022 TaxID=2977129 RepID=UPI0021CEED12|nr:Na/Pi symporter [Paenibacillus sp. J5C2022]MCU6707662.1 Na/Pi symporter [Paenibacillus sp. J5C2022]